MSVTAPQTEAPGQRLTGRKGFPLLLRIFEPAPAMPVACRYQPTCSDYAQQAIEMHGAGYGTLLAAWGARAKFEGRASVRTWVFTIARNRWIDRRRRDKTHGIEQTMESAGTTPSNTPGPATIAGRNEFAGALQGALARLSEEQREALLLREKSGLTFPEIAALLAVPTATVKSRVRYALLKLAEELRSFRAELES